MAAGVVIALSTVASLFLGVSGSCDLKHSNRTFRYLNAPWSCRIFCPSVKGCKRQCCPTSVGVNSTNSPVFTKTAPVEQNIYLTVAASRHQNKADKTVGQISPSSVPIVICTMVACCLCLAATSVGVNSTNSPVFTKTAPVEQNIYLTVAASRHQNKADKTVGQISTSSVPIVICTMVACCLCLAALLKLTGRVVSKLHKRFRGGSPLTSRKEENGDSAALVKKNILDAQRNGRCHDAMAERAPDKGQHREQPSQPPDDSTLIIYDSTLRKGDEEQHGQSPQTRDYLPIQTEDNEEIQYSKDFLHTGATESSDN